MFCKNCGKEIAGDSKFCQYCGACLDAVAHEQEKPIEVELSNKDGEALHVEISKKKVDNSKAVANEIVGNLKMLGLAICLFAAYMLIFVIVRQKDIKHYDYATHQSYFGESCYDADCKRGSYVLSWEEAYYRDLDRLHYDRSHPDIKYYWDCALGVIPKSRIDYVRYNKGYEELLSYQGPIVVPSTRDACLGSAHIIERQWKLSDDVIASKKEEAIKTSQKDIERWNSEINSDRKYGYERELKENAKYAAIICLLVCILGRYLYLLIKWCYVTSHE